MQRIRDGLRSARDPALALLTAFLLGAVLIVLTDFEHLARIPADPIAAIGGALADLAEGYAAMFTGAIGDPARIIAALGGGAPEDIAAAVRPLSETLLIATPFVFAGLGLAISFRAGLFNLGVDGQYLIAGLGATITASVAAAFLPPYLALVVGVAGGTAAGGAYAFIPGFLKARTGAHEVITTLMLNGVAPNLAYLVVGLIGLSGAPVIAAVPRLSDLPNVRVDYSFFIALGMAVAVSLLLFRSTIGFELRAAGFNRTAARAAGIRPGRTIILAMTLSGALIGMGSALFSLGPAFGLGGAPTWDFGYVAIALALLAAQRPSAVVLAAVLYGALTTGAKDMVVATGVPLALLMVIVAFAIIFMSSPALTRWVWRRKAPVPGVDTGAERGAPAGAGS